MPTDGNIHRPLAWRQAGSARYCKPLFIGVFRLDCCLWLSLGSGLLHVKPFDQAARKGGTGQAGRQGFPNERTNKRLESSGFLPDRSTACSNKPSIHPSVRPRIITDDRPGCCRTVWRRICHSLLRWFARSLARPLSHSTGWLLFRASNEYINGQRSLRCDGSCHPPNRPWCSSFCVMWSMN